jgi:hypothetical protein
MTEVSAQESTLAESSKRKRRAPARASRRIAAMEEEPEPQLPKHTSKPVHQKQERRKAAAPQQLKEKADGDRETVITDHGYTIHPNGIITLQSKVERDIH